jgi:hypothetical protein
MAATSNPSGFTDQGLSGIWIGFADSLDALSIVVGASLYEGALYSFVDAGNLRYQLRMRQYGAGISVSGGMVVVIATSLFDPEELKGLLQSGWDFQINLEGKWGAIAKSLPKMKYLSDLAKTGVGLAKKRIATRKLIEKNDLWIHLVKDLDLAVDASEPVVAILDFGAGIGDGAGVYYESGHFELLSVRWKAPKAAESRG